MNRLKTPLLAAPGKGLPFLEHLIARYYALPKFWRASTWESALQLHERQGQKILALAKPLSEEQMQKRVLVHGIRGIEDSSRFWSVGMTIEHLIIVGNEMLDGMVLLSQGKVPNKVASIAAVKPKGENADRSIIAAYETFLNKYRDVLASGLQNRDSKTRFRHPWFGLMTAFQWHCLAAVHTHLHRKQIEAILKGS